MLEIFLFAIPAAVPSAQRARRAAGLRPALPLGNLKKVKETVTKQAEDKLVADSNAVAFQVSNFFTKYLSGVQQGAAAHQLALFLNRSTSMALRLNHVQGYDEIKSPLDRMASTDTETIQTTWIGDFGTSQITPVR